MTPSNGHYEDLELLVTVKAYPAVGRKHGEAVCVAGIDLRGHRWIRLYPMHYRDLPFSQKFKKFEIIKLRGRPARRDPRPESYTPLEQSLQRIAGPLPAGKAIRRREILEPLMQPSMCAIRRQQKLDRTSLGVFPAGELLDFVVEPEDPAWSPAQELRMDQMSMLYPETTKLEKIPYRFKYEYQCEDEPGCKGHSQSIIDWELGEAFRRWRTERGSEEAAIEAIRYKWGEQMWGPGRDTFFFTGNRHDSPDSFMVLGVFWPAKLKAGRVSPSSADPELGLF